MFCKPAAIKSQTAFYLVVEACYMWRDFGTQLLPTMDADMCNETYIEGKLDHVSCKTTRRNQAPLVFHPDGGFIESPPDSALIVSLKPDKDYKDSLAVNVGKCSRLD